MKRLLCLAIVLAATGTALGQIVPPGNYGPRPGNASASSGAPSGPIHPAVVRVIAPNRDGMSLGSGALVAVTDRHGLVVTNWHVVCDATGPITVAFPDGFRTGAKLLKTDRDWDLAALAIWRPNVQPVPVASEPPRPGEPLTIAGYGGGAYRMITGRCTQYVSPGYNQPFEMVELSVPARQGDSGGPIFNSRGEIAGVLWGTGGGNTTGSYCGRVRSFLASVVGDFQRLEPSQVMVAQRGPATPAGSQPIASPINPPLATNAAVQPPGRLGEPSQPRLLSAPTASISGVQPVPGSTPTGPAIALPPPPGNGGPAVGNANDNTLWDVARNFLAVVGGVFILFQTVRLMTTNEGNAGTPTESYDDEYDDDDEDDDE